MSNGGSPESDLRAWHWQARDRLAGFAAGMGFKPDLLPKGYPRDVARLLNSPSQEPVAAAFCLPDLIDDHNPFEQASSYVEALLAEGAMFDALVCHNDHWAVGAMHALAEANIPVPCSVAVTGFDDTLIAQYHPCPITTFQQPLERMAARAVERILAQVEGLVWDDQRAVEKHSCEMICRRSSEPADATPQPEIYHVSNP